MTVMRLYPDNPMESDEDLWQAIQEIYPVRNRESLMAQALFSVAARVRHRYQGKLEMAATTEEILRREIASLIDPNAEPGPPMA